VSKCRARWPRAALQADLLPVFTLPAPISAIAYYNKDIIYGLLFAVAAETPRTIAADPKHLGARVGVTLVLHTWGSALTHHPHVHGIVPGGGLALDADRWVPCYTNSARNVRNFRCDCTYRYRLAGIPDDAGAPYNGGSSNW
jgi:hypothetical protein